jgi:hypothetical protein
MHDKLTNIAITSGGFTPSCRKVSNSGTILNAECGDGHGGWVANSIDMSKYSKVQ